jgi:muramoyltetrapeptide carboxypeptidase
MNTRRDFIKTALILALGSQVAWAGIFDRKGKQMIKAKRLKLGDTIGLVNPAGAVFIEEDIRIVEELLANLGFKSVRGNNLLSRYGYLAGTDAQRAADLNDMFADPKIDALLTVRGGWGCGRLLPLLDYKMIAQNPKILSGYSDITALLLALYAKSGLVSFHGPVGISTWNDFSWNHFKSVLMDAEASLMQNPAPDPDERVQTNNRITTIQPGIAEGILAGGNLSVLTAMLGSDYLPDWKGKILFLEEIGEKIYKIDRMLTHLSLAGVLEKVSGIVIGHFTDCKPGEGYGSLTLEELFRDHFGSLGIPVFYGAMIGHIKDKFTVPVGLPARINADTGQIQLLEPAVL